MPGDAFNVFVSYWHEDKTLRRELEERLGELQREGVVGAWQERRITAGEEWRGWIDGDLKSADLIVLLVSAPLLESEYCRGPEIKQALERHTSGYAKVIPIIARPCDWRTEPFASLDVLPQGVGPVTEWRHRDDAWEDVTDGIREVADRLSTARAEVRREDFDNTAEYRRAVLSRSLPADQPAAAPPGEAPERRTAWTAILGGSVAAVVALAAIWMAWRAQQTEHDVPMARAPAEQSPRAGSLESPSAVDEPERDTAVTTERRTTPPPPETISSEADLTAAEPDPPAETPQEPSWTEAFVDRSPDESPAPGAKAAAGATDAEPVVVAGDVMPEPAAEHPEQADLERSLGILAELGSEEESDCLAVLIAEDSALTSAACARSSSVVIMGGNALTATRDEVFDLEPPPSPDTAVGVVKLLQGLGETYGFAATRAEDGFGAQSLSAHYVESSTIRSGECAAVELLAAEDVVGSAYVEDTTFDRWVRVVEAAAAEAISLAGSDWAALMPEALDASEVGLDGFVCRLARRPAGNVVLSAGGQVVGIGYPCEPFERLEPEVRDSLPGEIRQLELGCIASLSEIREDLPGVLGGLASP